MMYRLDFGTSRFAAFQEGCADLRLGTISGIDVSDATLWLPMLLQDSTETLRKTKETHSSVMKHEHCDIYLFIIQLVHGSTFNSWQRPDLRREEIRL